MSIEDKDPYQLFSQSYKLQQEELARNITLVEPEAVKRAVSLILHCEGKVILTGMGKSGLIARKLAATFSSTGTPSFFLHPAESLHGDLGVVEKRDVLIILAKSGESDEVISMLQVVKKVGCPVISILGNPVSSVGRMSSVILHAVVGKEADPLNLAPTTSTTVALVVGDALATTVSELKNFQPENFAMYHPAGQLGKRLMLGVEDFLRTDRGIPMVSLIDGIPSVLAAEPKLGGVLVTGERGELVGIITDGDFRRAVMKFGDIRNCKIEEIMTPGPTRIHKSAMAIEALRLMEEHRPSEISVLPVVDDDEKPVGLLRLHDLVQAGL